ncbi:hypothetical protein HK102_011906 [Quaeritorhiza haematococci]|nr:hypothetical protein HK102_011906 [Quaeritorhiza haematococci]
MNSTSQRTHLFSQLTPTSLTWSSRSRHPIINGAADFNVPSGRSTHHNLNATGPEFDRDNGVSRSNIPLKLRLKRSASFSIPSVRDTAESDFPIAAHRMGTGDHTCYRGDTVTPLLTPPLSKSRPTQGVRPTERVSSEVKTTPAVKFTRRTQDVPSAPRIDRRFSMVALPKEDASFQNMSAPFSSSNDDLPSAPSADLVTFDVARTTNASYKNTSPNHSLPSRTANRVTASSQNQHCLPSSHTTTPKLVGNGETIRPMEVPEVLLLEDAKLWAQFHSVETEMIVTKIGRCLFPTIRFQCQDMDPNALYTIAMDVVQVSPFKHKFKSSTGWTPVIDRDKSSSPSLSPSPSLSTDHSLSGSTYSDDIQNIRSGAGRGGKGKKKFAAKPSADESATRARLQGETQYALHRPITKAYIHPNSPQTGAFWMKCGVSFAKLKLTNRTLSERLQNQNQAKTASGKSTKRANAVNNSSDGSGSPALGEEDLQTYLLEDHQFYVTSFNKYQPRVHLIRHEDNTTINPRAGAAVNRYRARGPVPRFTMDDSSDSSEDLSSVSDPGDNYSTDGSVSEDVGEQSGRRGPPNRSQNDVNCEAKQVNRGSTGQKFRQTTFLFKETVFVAVTHYQNEKVNSLKKNYNPHAKGFKDSTAKAVASRIRSRISDSSSTLSTKGHSLSTRGVKATAVESALFEGRPSHYYVTWHENFPIPSSGDDKNVHISQIVAEEKRATGRSGLNDFAASLDCDGVDMACGDNSNATKDAAVLETSSSRAIKRKRRVSDDGNLILQYSPVVAHSPPSFTSNAKNPRYALSNRSVNRSRSVRERIRTLSLSECEADDILHPRGHPRLNDDDDDWSSEDSGEANAARVRNESTDTSSYGNGDQGCFGAKSACTSTDEEADKRWGGDDEEHEEEVEEEPMQLPAGSFRKRSSTGERLVADLNGVMDIRADARRHKFLPSLRTVIQTIKTSNFRPQTSQSSPSKTTWSDPYFYALKDSPITPNKLVENDSIDFTCSPAQPERDRSGAFHSSTRATTGNSETNNGKSFWSDTSLTKWATDQRYRIQQNVTPEHIASPQGYHRRVHPSSQFAHHETLCQSVVNNPFADEPEKPRSFNFSRPMSAPSYVAETWQHQSTKRTSAPPRCYSCSPALPCESHAAGQHGMDLGRKEEETEYPYHQASNLTTPPATMSTGTAAPYNNHKSMAPPLVSPPITPSSIVAPRPFPFSRSRAQSPRSPLAQPSPTGSNSAQTMCIDRQSLQHSTVAEPEPRSGRKRFLSVLLEACAMRDPVPLEGTPTPPAESPCDVSKSPDTPAMDVLSAFCNHVLQHENKMPTSQ